MADYITLTGRYYANGVHGNEFAYDVRRAAIAMVAWQEPRAVIAAWLARQSRRDRIVLGPDSVLGPCDRAWTRSDDMVWAVDQVAAHAQGVPVFTVADHITIRTVKAGEGADPTDEDQAPGRGTLPGIVGSGGCRVDAWGMADSSPRV